MKPRKPTEISARIASTRACRAEGRLVPKPATAPPHSARISTQRTIEPSWFAQVPLIL